jgi:hypothetical protein
MVIRDQKGINTHNILQKEPDKCSFLGGGDSLQVVALKEQQSG